MFWLDGQTWPHYVIHEAGEPHEGSQVCTRCGEVIVEQPTDPNSLQTVEKGGWVATSFRFFAPGPVSRGEGCTIAGVLPGARECGPAEEGR